VITNECKAKKAYVMDAEFIKEIHGNIYESKVNGLIPWALMQNATFWNKPDPNPGCAFRVYDDGTFEVEKAYYYFKQVARAGQKGMKIAYTEAMDSEIALIAFASDDTENPNCFVLVNWGDDDRKVSVNVEGSNDAGFKAFRTTGKEIYKYKETAGINDDNSENYKPIGEYPLSKNRLIYTAPANSVTTFYEN
jgi:hypothetical protein